MAQPRVSIRDRAKAPFVEDLLFGSIREIVEDGHGRSFLVESVMQAFGMNRHGVLAVFGNAPILDPVGVAGEARDFLVFHVDLEKPHRRRAVRVVNNFRVIFLLFEGLLVGAGILFRAEHNRVCVQPLELARRAG